MLLFEILIDFTVCHKKYIWHFVLNFELCCHIMDFPHVLGTATEFFHAALFLSLNKQPKIPQLAQRASSFWKKQTIFEQAAWKPSERACL